MNDTINRIVSYGSPVLDQIATDTASHCWIAFPDIRFLLMAVAYVCRDGVDGEIIELGCNIGHTSVGIQRLLDRLGDERRLHVCDSFSGLPAPCEQDRGSTYDDVGFSGGALSCSVENLTETFHNANLSLPVIHHGWFRDITDYPSRLAFSFVDGDLYQSILDGLDAVYPRTVDGGIIMVHDYNYPPLPGAKKACDAFFSNKNETVIPVADSAVIIKGK